MLLLAVAAYLGATLYPDYTQPTGAKAQEAISKTFELPLDADHTLVGDILLERFYAREVSTGRIYVADMCKGRVVQLVEDHKDDGTVKYSVLLDRRNINPTRVRALVSTSAMPEGDATYLGVQVQGGNTDVFPVNYSGLLAADRADFRGPNGEKLDAYLAKFTSSNIGPGVRVLINKDNDFLLNSTAIYPYFTTLFGIKDAVFVSKLVFVDATSASGIAAMTQ